nr:TRAP transporter large permease subunit [Spirochaetales bacterium]
MPTDETDAGRLGPLLNVAMACAALGAAALTLVPVLNLILARLFWRGLPEAGPLTEHALIALAFFAAAVAGIRGTHLSLGSAGAAKGRLGMTIAGLRSAFSTAVDTTLFFAGLSLVLIGFEPADRAFGVPIAVFASPLAVGYLLMTIADLARPKGRARLASFAGLAVGVFLSASPIANVLSAFGVYLEPVDGAAAAVGAFCGAAAIPLIVLLVALAFRGLPLYAVIAGSAILLYLGAGSAVELMPSEAYSLFMNDSMPAIPLFTLAGFVLSESGAGRRLVAVFREWFGWMPGGEAFAAVLVCAFFTTFTGANGVAILALGGILATVLTGSGAYDERFAHGFLTASSSVGLLFPPSMAVIV